MELTIKVSSVADAEQAIEVLRAYVAFHPVSAICPTHLVTGSSVIGSLGISVRTENCLKNEGISSIDELLLRSERQLLTTPNLGRKALRELVEVLNSRGLHLQP